MLCVWLRKKGGVNEKQRSSQALKILCSKMKWNTKWTISSSFLCLVTLWNDTFFCETESTPLKTGAYMHVQGMLMIIGVNVFKQLITIKNLTD